MTPLDHLLNALGLQRKARSPFARVTFTRCADPAVPDTVVIECKNGQRIAAELTGPKRARDAA